ncbi:MAG: 4-phosphoerythronate dehydrogenase [Pseudomonadota bacterium]
MRILADNIISDAAQAFAAYGTVELFDGRSLERSQLADTDILLVRSVTKVSAELISNTNVKFVGTATAGVDHIDQAMLHENEIEFASAPGCNANAVSEFITTSVLIFCDDENIAPETLSVGIIGYGEVGTRVVQKLSALGLHCLVCDPPKAAGAPDAHQFVDLATALEADVITLHTPLVFDGPHPTANLLDARLVRDLSNCRLLINAARGGIVDEMALIQRCLDEQKFRVAIDCWREEPTINLDLLRHTYLASPHVAGHSIDARLNATRMLARSLSAWSGISNDWLQAGTVGSSNNLNEMRDLEGDFDVGPGNGEVAQLRKLVEQCCPVSKIDLAARGLANMSPGAIGSQFDKLRREFATRREFPMCSADIAGLPVPLQNKLAQLGFAQ